ncbi:MAG: bifunctional cobalt-precorrin-7 (C(5))-methyltransferase/cobalt-precorrin-6B (C(15))-methyltransferase [Herpetosiphon sp.]
MITIIGLHDPAALSEAHRALIAAADLLVGGERHLRAFPAAGRRRLVVDRGIAELLIELNAARAAGLEVVILASGDPLWFGIGATLRRVFTPADLHILPAPSSAQLAFAALGEPWSDSLLLSAHGRPLEPVIIRMLGDRRRTAILTDEVNTPAAIAGHLLAAGYADCRAVVCEQLATPRQCINETRLSALLHTEFDPLNVLVVLPADEAAPDCADRPFGLRDDELEHDGLITHLEVRAVALAALRLRPTDTVWDIGAGSGAVSLEAARIACRGTIYAVERSADRVAACWRNLARWGTDRIHLVHGVAPAACMDWPAPNAIFLGGTGAATTELAAFCADRLQPGGRLVLNLVTLELLAPCLSALTGAGLAPTVQQIAASRSRPLRGQTYLAALNPVYVVSGVQTGAASNGDSSHATS